jgi:hypothetical protein
MRRPQRTPCAQVPLEAPTWTVILATLAAAVHSRSNSSCSEHSLLGSKRLRVCRFHGHAKCRVGRSTHQVCLSSAVWQPRRRRRRRRHQPGAPADPQLVDQLADMGFDREQVPGRVSRTPAAAEQKIQPIRAPAAACCIPHTSLHHRVRTELSMLQSSSLATSLGAAASGGAGAAECGQQPGAGVPVAAGRRLPQRRRRHPRRRAGGHLPSSPAVAAFVGSLRWPSLQACVKNVVAGRALGCPRYVGA